MSEHHCSECISFQHRNCLASSSTDRFCRLQDLLKLDAIVRAQVPQRQQSNRQQFLLATGSLIFCALGLLVLEHI